MKNLMLYDFLLVKGGAESLSLELCENLPDFDLLTSFVDKNNFPELPIPAERVHTLGRAYYHPVLQAILLSRSFSNSRFKFDDYANVIFSGAYAPLAVNNRSKEKGNILYCHSPPRFIYDLKEYYMASIPPWQRPLLSLLIKYLRPQFETAAQRMNLILANSKNVQARIKLYLGHESQVVYPPCDTSRYQWDEQQGYYLSTARLEPYKRVDLIVEAFKKMPDKKLVIASGGSQLANLKKSASSAPNITFTDWIPKNKLTQLISNAIATLYLPINEDFGMSPVESMSAGKPVIGVNEGGVKESVLHEQTGILVKANPDVEDIIQAVTKLDVPLAHKMRTNCQLRAKSFDTSRFIKEIQSVCE